jgi:hypothetical protein
MGYLMSVATGNFSFPVGYIIECGGAWLRAQIRNTATVITVTGRVDTTNLELLLGHLRRFAKLETPVIIDVNRAEIDDSEAIERLLSTFGAECRRRATDWALVAPSAVRLSLADEEHVVHRRSVVEAWQQFVMLIEARRNMPVTRLRGFSVSRPTYTT